MLLPTLNIGEDASDHLVEQRLKQRAILHFYEVSINPDGLKRPTIVEGAPSTERILLIRGASFSLPDYPADQDDPWYSEDRNDHSHRAPCAWVNARISGKR